MQLGVATAATTATAAAIVFVAAVCCHYWSSPMFLRARLDHRRQLMCMTMIIVVVTMTIPRLVWFRGSDALSICFNSLAVLFILELDNAIFEYVTWRPRAIPSTACLHW
jgi:hypothetical protein